MEPAPQPQKPTVKPPRKRWKKWLRRFTFLIVFLVLLAGVLSVGSREYYRAVGKPELARITKELDETDPGWRLEEMEAARVAKFPPPSENSAEIVAKAESLIPQKPSQKLEFESGDLPFPPRTRNPVWVAVSNYRPSDSMIDQLRAELEPLANARAVARSLKDHPRGGWQLVLAEPAVLTPLVHLQHVALVSLLLLVEAEAAALDGDNRRCVESIIAIVNAGRSIGDEPFAWSQSRRLGSMLMAARAVSQVLAWGELQDNELKSLQAGLAEEDRRLSALPLIIRGERAAWSEAFEAWKRGRWGAPPNPTNAHTPAGAMFELATARPSGLQEPLIRWWHRGSLATDHAKYLELVTKFQKDCAGSHQQRLAACEQLKAEQRQLYALDSPEYFQYIGTRLFLPDARKLVDSDATGRASNRCAIAAIACERFRLRTGGWPKALSEIPTDILPKVPLDPFDDQPLRFQPTDDGVMVHSIGTVGEAKTAIAVRLWNAPERGKPLPPDVQKP